MSFERNNQLVNPDKWRNRWLFFGILLSFVVFFGIWQMPNAKEIEQVKASIDNLYHLKKDQVVLKSNIAEDDIEQVQAKIDQLPFLSRYTYQTKLNRARDSFAEIENARSIFVLNDSDGKKVLIPEVDRSSLESKIASCKESKTDICQIYYEAEEILDQIDIANKKSQELPSIKVRGDIEPALKALNEFEKKYGHLVAHPQSEELKQNIGEYADILGKSILDGHQFGDYSENFYSLLEDTDSLSDPLRGSSLDNQPLIALTFDDGPNADITPKLLDILNKHGVKATFFVMGAYVDENPELAKRIVDEGHLIGNHTYNHFDLATLSDEEVMTQIDWTQESIVDATGVKPDLYRMPFGSGGWRVVDLLNQHGMTSILWNLDTLDWSTQDADSIIETVEMSLQHHTLLLMHDTHEATPEAIDVLIPMLREQGYEFVFPEQLAFEQRYFEE